MATKTGYVDFISTNTSDGTRTLRVYWQETVDLTPGATSTVAITKVQFSTDSFSGYTYYADFVLKINGETAVTIPESSWTCYVNEFNTFYDVKKGSDQITGSRNIAHNADGSKSVNISIHTNNWSYAGLLNDTPYAAYRHPAKFTDGDSKSITLTKIPVGTLTVNAGTGSSVSVTRGGTALANGAALYSGDVLTVAATAASGYAYPTYTTSGGTRSGNTVTVGTGGVTVTSSATRAYTLTRSQGTGTTLTTQVTVSPVRSVPVTISGSSGTVYAGETVKVTGSLATGYGSLVLKRGSTTINNNSTFNVSAAVTVSSTAGVYVYGITISQGAHTHLAVYRVESPLQGAATGLLGGNDPVYYGDVLEIRYSADAGYRIVSVTCNGTAVTSYGERRTVKSAMTVATVGEAYGASDFTTSGSTMGSPVTISIQKANSSFTHSLHYRFSGDTDTDANWHLIDSEKFPESSKTWTPGANALGAKIPTAMSGVWKLRLTTYNGDAEIGTTIHDVTLNIPANAAPTVVSGWAGIGYTNAGTDASGITASVKGYSIIRWSLDVSKITLQYGATLASVKAVCGGTTQTKTASGTYSMGVAATVTNSMTVTVTDSRGKTYTNLNPLTLTVNDYAKPALSGVSVFRCDDQQTPSDVGTYISAKATAVVSSLADQNTKTLKAWVKEVGGSYGSEETLTSGTATRLGAGGYYATKTYVVKLTVTDALGNTATLEITVPTASVTLNLRDGGNGAAFGKFAEEADLLDVAWDLKVKGTMMTMAMVTGTLASSADWGTAVAYPAGFTQSNCQIVSFEVYNASMWKSGYGLTSAVDRRTFAALQSGGVNAFNNDSGLYGAEYRVLLRRL